MAFKGLILALLANLALHRAPAYGRPYHIPTIPYMDSCQVGSCPGPCPTQSYDKFLSSRRPYMATVKRGGLLRINGFKNDRVGGFARWSITRVQDMNKHEAHERGSFLFTCADVRPSKCPYEIRELCRYDHKKEYYKHYIRIPKVFPDSLYTLGFVRYGSLPRSGSCPDDNGFGDYYGCVRIQIKGGPLKSFYRPKFSPGPSITGNRKYCRSATNRLRCASRRCYKLRVSLTRPVEFVKGQKKRIFKKWFPEGRY